MQEIHDPIAVDLYTLNFFFSMRVSDKLEHIFPCKVCNENKPTGLKTNVSENVQSILDGVGGGWWLGEDRLTGKMSGLEFRLYNYYAIISLNVYII